NRVERDLALEEAHLLDLAVGLREPVALGECLRALVGDLSAEPGQAERLPRLDGGLEQCSSDPGAPGVGMHTRRDIAALGIVRAAAETGADDLSVELRDEPRPVGSQPRPEFLDRPGGLVREDRSLDANPALEVGVALGAPDVDHPERFNFP